MILVAGGTGMLGTKVVGLLRQRQLEVRVLTRDRNRAADLASAGVDIVEGDVVDPAAVRRAVDGVDFEILHPVQAPAGGARVSSNARSCVLRVGNARHAAFLTGDIEVA